MKKIVFLTILASLLVGCAAMEEAYYVDREFGVATSDAFDRQIVHQDYKYAGEQVEGLPALYGESTMETFNTTFSRGFTTEAFDITEVGVEGGE